jgi:[acyl-carrier-protein] S-malonyltransferase
MAPAVAVLDGYARAMTTHDPRTRLLSNTDGTVVHDGRQVLSRLVSQVSNPVRWDLCTDTMRDLGVTGFIEIPPAGTLTGLVRRALPDVEALALKTPDDLEAARDMVARHGQSSGLSQSPTWRLVVAPAKGTVSVTHLEAGTTVGTGQTIATVASLRDTYDVVAPHGGRVVEWLVEDGDPVSPGQPIVRLHPQEVPA